MFLPRAELYLCRPTMRGRAPSCSVVKNPPVFLGQERSLRERIGAPLQWVCENSKNPPASAETWDRNKQVGRIPWRELQYSGLEENFMVHGRKVEHNWRLSLLN